MCSKLLDRRIPDNLLAYVSHNFYIYQPFFIKFTETLWLLIIIIYAKYELSSFEIRLEIRFFRFIAAKRT